MNEENKIKGTFVVWGNAPAPQFPAGWRVERSRHNIAIAVSGNGAEFAIGDGVLYPFLFRDYDTGKRVFDFKNPVPLEETVKKEEEISDVRSKLMREFLGLNTKSKMHPMDVACYFVYSATGIVIGCCLLMVLKISGILK